MYNADKIKGFYNEYGIKEWERLDITPYDRINFHLHMAFMKEHIGHNKKVLDAGCGAGRFSIEIAKSGSRVTCLDISDEQINIAKEKLEKAGVMTNVDDCLVGDISNLSMFEDNTFDAVICYGAVLSYLLENTEKAISELVRVTKKGGNVLVSVNNRWGIFRLLMGRDNFDRKDFFGRPDYWYIDEVARSGNLKSHENVAQPPRHFFEGEKLKSLLNVGGLKNIILGGSPCLSCGQAARINELIDNAEALETILRLEKMSYCKPTMADSGEFLLAKETK